MYIEFKPDVLVDMSDITGIRYNANTNETLVYTNNSQVPFVTVPDRTTYDIYYSLLELQKSVLKFTDINIGKLDKLMEFYYTTKYGVNEIVDKINNVDDFISKLKNKEALYKSEQLDLFDNIDTKNLN